MKLSILALSAALTALAAGVATAQNATPSAPHSAAPAAAPAPPPAPTPGQTSYTIGFNIGSQMKSDGVAIDADELVRGIKDAQSGAKPALSLDLMSQTLSNLQTQVREHRKAQAAQAAENNKTQGAAYLKANAAKPGVVTTPSGLQYEVLVAGKGPKPKASDTVVCNYRGTLIDGTEFDASDKHGGPATFPVGGVIKGWTEALQLMPVGSKWRIVLPSELAYGEKGVGAQIGPNAVLTFEVELVSIQSN